jgi:hypothetical protein
MATSEGGSMVKLKGLSEEEMHEIFHEKTLLAGYVGSISHGTYVPKSDPNSIDDKDVMFVYIKELPYYLGLGRGKDNVSYKVREWDVVGYELKKYLHLLLKSNPKGGKISANLSSWSDYGRSRNTQMEANRCQTIGREI